MEFYLAVCNETRDVKLFVDYSEFKDFSIEKRYSYSYYSLEGMEEIPDVDLFYYL